MNYRVVSKTLQNIYQNIRRLVNLHIYKIIETFAYNAGRLAATGFLTFYLLHGFKPNQLINLALIPTVPDYEVLEALKNIQKKDLPRFFSGMQED